MKSDLKIAVCLGGQIRTGIRAYTNIKQFIGKLWNNCDFFIHTWDWEFTKDYDRRIFKGKELGYPKDRFPPGIDLTDEHINDFINLYKPKRYEVQSKQFFNVSRGIRIDPGRSQFDVWHTKFRSLQLKHDYEIINNFTYDVVIMMRPDLIFSPTDQLTTLINNWNFNLEQIYYNLDLFWIMGSKMSDYVRVKFQDEILKYSDNRILGQQLTGEEITSFFVVNNIDMKYIQCFNFTILRKEANKLDPIQEYEYCRNVQNLYFSDLNEELINLPLEKL